MALVHPWSSWAREPARRGPRGTPLLNRGSSRVGAKGWGVRVEVASGGGRERVPLAVSGPLWVSLLSVLEGGGAMMALW